MAEPGADPFEGQRVDEPIFLVVLDAAIDALEAAGIPYGIMGGLASASLGRPRWTHDIDFFVSPDRADAALEALERAGFATQRTNAHWLYKGIRDAVLVDVLFQSRGGIFLDEEMLSRLVVAEFKGRRLKVLSPEDLIVIKALSHDEDTPRHWFDALSIVSAGLELDWTYLLRRARRGPRRVLSLLLYALSVDLVVPEAVLQSLFETIIGHPGSDGRRGEQALSVTAAARGKPV